MRHQLDLTSEVRGPATQARPLPSEIKQSWARCRHLSLRGPSIGPLGLSLMRDRREQSARLLASALPELDALAEHATGNGCVVVLSDPSGLILEEIGSPDFLTRAERVALTPGVDWSEGLRGTNAIGTALIEGLPVLVLGAEHYLPQNASLGCAAAPIFTGTGSIAGALDVSGDVARVDSHALGMVRMAAQQIEHRLMLADARGHLLRFHAKAGLVGTSREALMAVENGRVIAANRIALWLLRLDWPDLLGKSVEDLFGRGWGSFESATGRQTSVRPPTGEPFQLQIDRMAHTSAPKRTAAPVRSDVSSSEPEALMPTLRLATRVLDQGVSVLVTGETGSGKEVFARRLHAASRRARGPFVAVNCAALPETLIEAELFGYDEGAFTGARRKGSPGRIREAHGGVLFLDEIADMPLALQTRLLRVLDDHRVTPLGGGPSTAVDFDLVCATHGDLRGLAATGAFRADLLYRVAGYSVRVPALRERGDRRALIASLFDTLGGTARRLSLDEHALDALAAHDWPGNVRELVSVLRAMAALADSGQRLGRAEVDERIGCPLDSDDVNAPTNAPYTADAIVAIDAGNPAWSTAPGRVAFVAPQRLAEVEQHAIEQALIASGQGVSEAARRLGIHRSTVYRFLASRRAV